MIAPVLFTDIVGSTERAMDLSGPTLAGRAPLGGTATPAQPLVMEGDPDGGLHGPFARIGSGSLASAWGAS